MANFPPPPGLTGYQKGQWWSHGYYRHCTADEAAVLEADRTAALAARRAADERAAYFAQIAAEVRLPPAGRGRRNAKRAAAFPRAARISSTLDRTSAEGA